MDSRQARIGLLSRINSGRTKIPAFLAGLSTALGENVEASALISLPETDALFLEFRTAYRSSLNPGSISYRKFFVAAQEKFVFELISCVAGRLNGEWALFLAKQSEECGAVEL